MRSIGRLISWSFAGMHRLLLLLTSLINAVTARIDYLIALLRSPWQITQTWDLAPPVSGVPIAIFAHFDRRRVVRPYVLAHLAGLHDAGCQVLFVSNCAKLNPKSLTALRSIGCSIILRRNWGGSWGAWREGLQYLAGKAEPPLLLLVDDTNYGPLVPLAPVLAALDFSEADIWGLTDSWHVRWHLESYFLAVHPRVLRHPAWQKFWSGMAPVRSRRWLYSRGEVGFSQSLLRAALRLQPRSRFSQLCQSVDRTPAEGDRSVPADLIDPNLAQWFRYHQMQQIDHLIASHRPFNPTHTLWRQLLDQGHPYLSRELLLRNPEQVRDVSEWPHQLPPSAAWARAVVEADLPGPSAARQLWLQILDAAGFVAKAVRFVTRRVDEELSQLRSHLRSHRQARLVWPATRVECGPRVVVFVHFDRYGEVRPYVLHYLRALRDAGVSILFVSNSGKLKPVALESLKPLCFGIIVRGNIGYDFGAWREGLEYLKGSLDRLEWLAIANDSLYGPLAPLGALFDRMNFTVADVWGLTDSKQRNWHLQSYFLAFSRRVLRSSAWHEFWRGVLPVKSKSWAISHGELKITGALQQAGFKCAALFPYQSLIAQLDPIERPTNRGASPFYRLQLRQRRNLAFATQMGYALNPTAELWRQLLRQGFPFLKRELLRSNPSDVPDTLDWQSEVAATSGADIRLIEEDLRKSVRGRVA